MRSEAFAVGNGIGEIGKSGVTLVGSITRLGCYTGVTGCEGYIDIHESHFIVLSFETSTMVVCLCFLPAHLRYSQVVHASAEA